MVNAEQKKIKLVDESGKCFRRHHTKPTDDQYFVSGLYYDPALWQNPPDGCDTSDMATLTVGVASDGKGVTLTQGTEGNQFRLQRYTLPNLIEYLGMSQDPESVDQQFSLYSADAPKTSNFFIKSNLLKNVKYDMANGIANIKPTKVGSVRCRMGAGTSQVTLKQQTSASETSSWSSATRFDVGTKTSVEAGVPLTAQTTTTFTMSMSETMTFTNGETLTNIQETDVILNCPANSDEVFDMVWEKGTYTIPYVGDLERVLEFNGVKTKYIFQNITGMYNGISGQTISICDEFAQGSQGVCSFDETPIALN